MGRRDSLAIPELQQPTGEVKAAAAEFHDGANSPLSEVTGSGEMVGNYIPGLTPYFSISFPLYLACYQVAAWPEWNLLSPLGLPFPG